MPEVNDPELLQAPRSKFASRSDLKTIVEYQQRLHTSIQELHDGHKAMHAHISKLTESHNQVRLDANELLKAQRDINDKISQLEARIEKLEQNNKG